MMQGPFIPLPYPDKTFGGGDGEIRTLAGASPANRLAIDPLNHLSTSPFLSTRLLCVVSFPTSCIFDQVGLESVPRTCHMRTECLSS